MKKKILGTVMFTFSLTAMLFTGCGSEELTFQNTTDNVTEEEDSSAQDPIFGMEEKETGQNVGDETVEEEIEQNVGDGEEIAETTPFQQEYWVIFTEGYRNDRIEASTIDSTLPADQLSIIWNSHLELNDTSGSDSCDQYYLDENGEWVYRGSYHRLSDRATEVIASNLDVVDKDGNVIISGIPYSAIDWDEVERYR